MQGAFLRRPGSAAIFVARIGLMDERALELKIEREERLLHRAAALLRAEAPLREWPPSVRDALAGALAEGAENPLEDDKAKLLAEHLFVGLPGLDPDPTQRRSRAAERLRADLIRLVPAGAGLPIAAARLA